MTKRTCKWHKCHQRFEPQHGSQQYCSSRCRQKRLEWAKTRGSAIVNMLLDTPWDKVVDASLEAKQRLEREVHDAD